MIAWACVRWSSLDQSPWATWYVPPATGGRVNTDDSSEGGGKNKTQNNGLQLRVATSNYPWGVGASGFRAQILSLEKEVPFCAKILLTSWEL